MFQSGTGTINCRATYIILNIQKRFKVKTKCKASLTVQRLNSVIISNNFLLQIKVFSFQMAHERIIPKIGKVFPLNNALFYKVRSEIELIIVI